MIEEVKGRTYGFQPNTSEVSASVSSVRSEIRFFCVVNRVHYTNKKYLGWKGFSR